ncbi:MAG TPA: acyltransferase [Longimicrobium sp.]|nr:acyltransferase [Longimicrobium sp.]
MPPPAFADRLSGGRIPVLDGVRALAIAIVVAAHVAPLAGGAPIAGDLGVTLFFVLSGFLITRLLLAEWGERGRVSLRDFYARRVLRIFPAYYVFLAVWYAASVAAGDAPSPAAVLSALTYTLNYLQAFHGQAAPGVAHAWSLAVEEQFYLLWPPVLVLLLARGGRRRAAAALVAAVAVVGAWRTYAVWGTELGPGYAYNAFDTRFDALAAGCLLAVAAGHRWLGRAAAAVSRWSWLPLVTLALLFLPPVAMPLRLRYGPGLTLDALLFAVLIVQMVMLADRGAWRVFSSAPVRFVGTISYPLYLYHVLAVSAAARLALPPAGRVAAALLLSIAAACASYYIVEKPFLRLKTRFARVDPSSAPEPHLPPGRAVAAG